MDSSSLYALKLSYRGERYAGWQRQTNALTVQQAVEEALCDLLGTEVRIHAASRTDAGVHARGQVAHLCLERPFPVGGLQHGTNRRLPDDIRVMAVHRMSKGFHARKSALAKEYRYRLICSTVLSPLDAPFAIRAPAELDWTAIRQATAALVGSHDFSAFALSGGGHGQPVRRILEAEWCAGGGATELRIVGDGFLRGMVRSLVGSLLEVGRGRMAVGAFTGLLCGGARGDAGPTAPARGLVLQEVRYPPEWDLDEAGIAASHVLD